MQHVELFQARTTLVHITLKTRIFAAQQIRLQQHNIGLEDTINDYLSCKKYRFSFDNMENRI